MENLVCPNCGSQQIEYSSLMTKGNKTITGLGIPEMYYCPNCGYEGPVILELDQHQMEKAKFANKDYKKKPEFKAPGKKSQEILRPIFTIVLLLFLFITALSFLPSGATDIKYYSGETFEEIPESKVPLTGLTRVGVRNVPELGGPVVIQETPTGEIFLETHEADLPEMDVKSGLEGVTGFFFPLFVVLFVLGFIGLMLAKHYERQLKFI